MRWLRIELADRNESALANLTVDLLVDDAGRPKHGIPYVGWWGALRGVEVWPFVYRFKSAAEGYVIDFGRDKEDDIDANQWPFELVNHHIRLGEEVRFDYDDETYHFKVVKVADVAEGVLFD
jgi:hypothetical protein